MTQDEDREAWLTSLGRPEPDPHVWTNGARAGWDAAVANLAGQVDTNTLAERLAAAWAKAEPDHPITRFPASYVATWADIAAALSAVLAAARRVDGDRVADLRGSVHTAVSEAVSEAISEHGDPIRVETGYDESAVLYSVDPERVADHVTAAVEAEVVAVVHQLDGVLIGSCARCGGPAILPSRDPDNREQECCARCVGDMWRTEVAELKATTDTTATPRTPAAGPDGWTAAAAVVRSATDRRRWVPQILSGGQDDPVEVPEHTGTLRAAKTWCEATIAAGAPFRWRLAAENGRHDRYVLQTYTV